MIEILYEDDGLIAVDKPAGLATIPERTHTSCLLEAVQEQIGAKLYVVHRLDKDVSGVVLFARDVETHRFLNILFEERKVEKTYDAIVLGSVGADAGEITAPIRQFGSGRLGVDERKGKPSRTRYAVRRRVIGYTQLDVFPLTGRRHQIRVHLYSVGHPIVGDPLYGETALQKVFPRLFLHARRIALTGPDDRPVRVTSPTPHTFEAFMDDPLQVSS
jgi:tRNA pseudouridine32 synthase/23S rRNA pseudouridine746 synthase